MNRDALVEMLIKHEGIRESAYQDHLGYWTIGVGRLIDSRKGGKLSTEEITFLLNNDITKCIKQLENNIPYFLSLTTNQRMGLVNMCFQLGISGLLKFKKLLYAIQIQNKDKIKQEAMDSNWYKQTPNRANEVILLLLS